jgi:predicted tellurium resistance membrane protein TerC
MPSNVARFSATMNSFAVSALPTLFLLVGMELVLGVDNVLVVSMLAAGFPARHRRRATTLGLALAVLLRLAALGGLLGLMKLSEPVIGSLSARDLAILGGGAFLIWKAVAEIHREIERPQHAGASHRVPGSFAAAIAQIALLDLVFSIDSIIAAVALTTQIWVIAGAIAITFGVVLAAAPKVAEFIQRNPSLRILCLAFLVCIGVSLLLDGFHEHFPRGYLYAPMCFALLIELLHQRRRKNLKRIKE